MKSVSKHVYLLLVFIPFLAFGQKDTSRNTLSVDLGGYMKNLETIIFSPLADEPTVDILFHNRINLNITYNQNLNLKVGMRNRLLVGESAEQPGFVNAIQSVQNGILDLSWNWWESTGVIGLTELDRLYVNYNYKDWQFRFGRQRINWGINLFWNPNDIFNAYAFTDFDYEERPGVDAVLVRKYWGFASGIEVAVAPAENWEDWIMGTRLQTNWKGYDMQFILGKFEDDVVGGFGWAGSLGNVGFKGEMSYFVEADSTQDQAFTGTVSAEYIFGSGVFLTGGFLYNSRGRSNAPVSEIFRANIDAKNLYPYETAAFVQSSYQFTPLFTGSAAVIYSFNDSHPLFFSPNFSYSMATNWDLDLIGQIALFQLPQQKYQSLVNALFLRVRYSF